MQTLIINTRRLFPALISFCLLTSLTVSSPKGAFASDEESSWATSSFGLHNMHTEISQTSRDFDAMLTKFRKLSQSTPQFMEVEAQTISTEFFQLKRDEYNVQIQLLAKARFENPDDPAIMALCQTVCESWYGSRLKRIWHSNPALAIYPELNDIIRKEIMLGRPVRCITGRCESSEPLPSVNETVDYSGIAESATSE